MFLVLAKMLIFSTIPACPLGRVKSSIICKDIYTIPEIVCGDSVHEKCTVFARRGVRDVKKATSNGLLQHLSPVEPKSK